MILAQSDHPVRDLVMFGIGCLILAGLLALIVWDLIESRRSGGRTLSARAKELWVRNQDRIAFWLWIGTATGFWIGLTLGFVLGHLFWPQTVPAQP